MPPDAKVIPFRKPTERHLDPCWNCGLRPESEDPWSCGLCEVCSNG